MNTILMIVLLAFAFILFLGICAIFTWLVIEKYIINRKFIRIIILKASGEISTINAKRIDEQKNIKGVLYSACKWKELTYFYKPEQIRKLGNRFGFFAYEKNFFALDLDFETMEDKSKMTVHPKIMTDILTTKLISELLQKDTKIELILLIVTIALLLIVGGLVFYFDRQIITKLDTLLAQGSEILKYVTPKKAGLLG
jgi:hypothetical protein